MARTALHTAKWVASLVNAESKYDETNVNGAAADDTTASIQTICNPAQGLTAITRSGDSIKMQTLTLRGSFDASFGTNQNAICRIIVLIDKENAISSLGQLLQSTGTSNTPFSVKNEDTKYDSRILLDKMVVCSPAYPIKTFEYVVQVNQHVHFQAGTTTIYNNALKIFAFSNIPIVTAPLVSYIARVSYLDN